MSLSNLCFKKEVVVDGFVAVLSISPVKKDGGYSLVSTLTISRPGCRQPFEDENLNDLPETMSVEKKSFGYSHVFQELTEWLLSPKNEESFSHQLVPEVCRNTVPINGHRVSLPCYHKLNRTIIRLLLEMADQIQKESMMERPDLFAFFTDISCAKGTLVRNCYFIQDARKES